MAVYRVRAFQVAELPVPGWECFFGRNDTAFHTLAFHVWVIEGNGRTIVVDAGPPPDEADFEYLVKACQSIDPRSTMRRLAPLDAVFAQAGVRAESIDALLLTQTITYHTGGLVAELFPRARVYLARAGMLEFLLDNPGHPPREAYFTEETWRYLRRLAVEDRLVLAGGPAEVAEGVWFETTGGHHPGSAAVKVATAAGRLGILETAFLRENVEQELPIGVAEDAALCRQVIRRYRRECDLVLACHDPTIRERFAGGVVA
ncbi:MAG TPA: hypothetical protein VFA33_14875 [Bryobacteraceae bacterium]|nr:hypothetical protein [Bryobacteraceae bacterium]